ncbi:hypothetical protein [Burkholderia glumae]
MSDKLSDCPCCDGAAELYYPFHLLGRSNESAIYHAGVRCKECGLRIGATTPPEKSIAAWNRRASPAPAIPAEPVPPFGWVQPRGGNYFTRSEVAAKRIGGLMPVYASPPASIAPAISESEDARDAARYRWLQGQRAHVWHEIADLPINRTNERIDAAIDAARKENQS